MGDCNHKLGMVEQRITRSPDLHALIQSMPEASNTIEGAKMLRSGLSGVSQAISSQAISTMPGGAKEECHSTILRKATPGLTLLGTTTKALANSHWPPCFLTLPGSLTWLPASFLYPQ